MRIALIAHDSRKELMAQFCTAYVRILSENDLIATGVTGKIVHDATGLPVRLCRGRACCWPMNSSPPALKFCARISSEWA